MATAVLSMDGDIPLAESGNGSPSEIAMEMSKGPANALMGQPTESMDKLGRRHRRDAGGRFCRKDGTTVDIDEQLLPSIDRRHLAYKRFRQIVTRIIVDQGDARQVSEARKGKSTPVTPAWFRKMFARLGVRAGMPFPINPHMLRHSCGFKFANEGKDTRSLQGYLGHRNAQSTVIYTQLSPDRFKGWEVE